MKKLILALWIVPFSPLSLFAQSNEGLKEKILLAHQTFIGAILDEDYKQVDQLLADDVTLGFPNGGFALCQCIEKRDSVL